jgi:hypothetical protein
MPLANDAAAQQFDVVIVDVCDPYTICAQLARVQPAPHIQHGILARTYETMNVGNGLLLLL